MGRVKRLEGLLSKVLNQIRKRSGEMGLRKNRYIKTKEEKSQESVYV
jgi:hypothetical protein